MNKTRKLTYTAVFSAIAVAVSAVESLVPLGAFMPPGAKLGMSNVVTMFASSCLGIPCALAIAVVKSLFVLATRGVTAFFMSLAGGLLSTLVCGLLIKSKKIFFGRIGIGIIGALLHNSAQISVCSLYMGSAVFAYLPFLCLASLVTGSASGLLLGLTEKHFPNKIIDKYSEK